MYEREVGRVALTEYGDEARLVMGSLRATRQHAFEHEAPNFCALAKSGLASASAEVPVVEIVALVSYLAEAIKDVEGVPSVAWENMTPEQREAFVDSLGASRLAVIFVYYGALALHASGVSRLPPDALYLIEYGAAPAKPSEGGEEE